MKTTSHNLQYAFIACMMAWPMSAAWDSGSAIRINGRVPEKLPVNAAVPVAVDIPAELAGRDNLIITYSPRIVGHSGHAAAAAAEV